jgi:hypothetical protein
VLQKRIWFVSNLRFLGSLFVCVYVCAHARICVSPSLALSLCDCLGVCFSSLIAARTSFSLLGGVDYILNPELS